MKHSLKHDLLLSLLAGMVCVNSLITIGAHWPTKPTVENLMLYRVPTVDAVNMPMGYVEELGLYQHMKNQTVLINATMKQVLCILRDRVLFLILKKVSS